MFRLFSTRARFRKRILLDHNAGDGGRVNLFRYQIPSLSATKSQAAVPSFGTIPSPRTFFRVMTDNQNPFADFDLERGIALRWALRDIKGKRLKLSPLRDADLRVLIDLGLVEMRDGAPVLTNAGHAALD